MKKVYEIPQIEVMLIESTELMETSMAVSDEPTSNPLSRETEMFFDDDED